MCIRNHIPVVMVLSGGYQTINAKVIANSIKNLYDKFDNIWNQSLFWILFTFFNVKLIIIKYFHSHILINESNK